MATPTITTRKLTRPGRNPGLKSMHDDKLNLFKNNDKKEWSALEWMQEFHDFMQGELPESIQMEDDRKPQLTAEQSMQIIWYLQEHCPVFPDNIEMCSDCKRLYDTHCEGAHVEKTGENYCGGCWQHVPHEMCDNCSAYFNPESEGHMHVDGCDCKYCEKNDSLNERYFCSQTCESSYIKHHKLTF